MKRISARAQDVSFLNIIKVMVRARFWKRGHGSLLWKQFTARGRKEALKLTDHDHIRAAACWLAEAQDAMTDGGVCGRYDLRSGWSSSYPETTGYIIPTFLALAQELRDESYAERAARAVQFLLKIQHENGAFPGMEIDENRDEPSAFNTAQIMHGLASWHRLTKDHTALRAARRAADWLVSIQDGDGAWSQHCHLGVAVTYSAHLSCWLAEIGRYMRDENYLQSAARHLDWTLTHRDKNSGWIDLAGFDREQHEQRVAFTHTIAYTLWGTLRTSELLERADGISAVMHAAERVCRRLELSEQLPGVLDSRWQPRELAPCLTGNSQMALVWMRLFELCGDARFLNAALKAIDDVRRVHFVRNRNPAIRGGVGGSDPIWGNYIHLGIPNWAAKYFVDALIKKREILANISDRPVRQIRTQIPAEVPTATRLNCEQTINVAMLTSQRSSKVAQMCEAWRTWGFKPNVVVISHDNAPRLRRRLLSTVRYEILLNLILNALPLMSATHRLMLDADLRSANPATYSAAHGIPVVHLDRLDSAKSVRALKKLAPDVLIHAGAGILRSATLKIPRLGTLNAHMGVLPYYRGMNVAEWAAFNHDDVGCSVHLIDSGIDTGDIIGVTLLDSRHFGSIRELRKAVDEAQITLLGRVARYVVHTGSLPPTVAQGQGQGRQFFTMHREIAEVLERELKDAQNKRGGSLALVRASPNVTAIDVEPSGNRVC